MDCFFNLILFTDNKNIMKSNLDTLILYVTLFLALAIFISVIFGCAFRKSSEPFANKKGGKDNSKSLSKFENEMLDGISAGRIGADKIAEYIKSGKFTQEHLSNMIKYAEKMKNGKANAVK